MEQETDSECVDHFFDYVHKIEADNASLRMEAESLMDTIYAKDRAIERHIDENETLSDRNESLAGCPSRWRRAAFFFLFLLVVNFLVRVFVRTS